MSTYLTLLATFCGIDTIKSDFTCYDGCEINDWFVNDYFCDCSLCEDEDYWTCNTCGYCPSFCGDSAFCGYNVSYWNPIFTCYSGCNIPQSYLNDNWCDCSNC